MPVAIIIALDAGLLVFAARRPWLGLTVLLAAMPFNGFLVDVVVAVIGLPDVARTAAAAWHDALAIGILVAAISHFVRARVHRLGLVEWLAVAMLAMGGLAIVISPFRLTALYEYRTLYEPPVLALALVILWRAGTMPPFLPERIARVMVGAGVAAAAFAGWQVYVGGVQYLNLYFRSADGTLPAAYFSSLVGQPRGFGPFHSPNEFGAYLALVVGLLIVPGVLKLRPGVRGWLLIPLGLALLLTLSRSAWVSTFVIAIVAVILVRPRPSLIRERLGLVRTRTAWLRYALPTAVFAVAASAILVSSNATSFIGGTISGQDPSASYRAHLIEDALQGLLDPGSIGQGSTDPGANGDGSTIVLRPRISILGMGLGTAGPKSGRFGETGSQPAISSETWYVNYLLQVGLLGLVILVLLVGAILFRLWQARGSPWPRAAIVIAAGLAVGAIAIPVIDEPAVAVPLWTVLGIGLALSEQTRRAPASAPGGPATG